MGCVTASGAPDSRMCPTAVVGTQKRLTRCFVNSKLRAGKHKNLQKSRNISIHTREPNTMSTSSMKKRFYHGTNASPDGLCTHTHTNEAFSCWFCCHSFRVDRAWRGNLTLEACLGRVSKLGLSGILKTVWVLI